MDSGSAGSGAAARAGKAEREPRLGAVFLGIVVVELLAIASLYWVGVHFAA